MTNLFEKYETDRQKETEGVEIDIDGAIFICRHAGGGNRKFRAAVGMEMNKPGMRERLNGEDKGDMYEADDELSIRAYADAVVLDWREVTDRNGDPWPYSKENFVELMTACPDLWTTLKYRAADIDNYRIKQVKEQGEELGNSSSGTDDSAKT